MSKRMPIYDEQTKKRAVAVGSFPPWDREALVRKIQANDGFSRSEAEMQIDAMAAEFRELGEPRRTLHSPSFYRTGMNAIVNAMLERFAAINVSYRTDRTGCDAQTDLALSQRSGRTV